MIKEILAAVYEHFKRICYTQSDFALLIKLLLQIGEKRYLFRCRLILDKMLVDALNTFVDNRAFLSGKTVATSDNDLTKRNQEVGLICDHFHRIAEQIIVNGNVHRVDMLFGIACNSDKLSVQSRNKRKILSFGVADDYVINCCKKAVEYFTLYAETLACTRRTEDKSIRIFEP